MLRPDPILHPEPDQQPPRNYWIDHYTPTYVEDPYGRQTTLEYETPCGSTIYQELIRLKQITDPSGRWIKITYACGQNGVCNCDNYTWWKITRVDGSDGSWVTYTPDAFMPTHVDYSDGTSADYTYGNTTYLMDTVCCPGGNCYNCTITANASKLIAAWDTHADSPMKSIYYEYKAPGRFEGQIRAEHQLASASPTASPAPGVAVSTFTSYSCPTHPWSQSPDCPSATQTETRGDGPSRTIYLEQAAQHVPLVKHKSDFNGINEVYTYDSNNYLLTAKDRNNYTTTYTNEPVLGNPTQILHPDGSHIDYTYSDNANPYHIHTVSDELGKVTTYTRSSVGSLSNLITRIDYPQDANTPASYEEFTYNGFGQVLHHHLKNPNAYESFAYDGSGLLTDRWNPKLNAYPGGNDPHIHYAYYTSGAWKDRAQTVTYPANCSNQVATETYEYDRDANGNPVHGRGLVTKITHADGASKLFAYDKFGNKYAEADETMHVTLYTYDDYKRLKTVTRAMPSPAPNETTTYFYTATNGASPYSHTTNAVRQIWSPTSKKIGHTYDNNFRLASTIQAETTNLAATTTFHYDNNGNQRQVTDPLNHSTNTAYDNRNRKQTVTDALNHVTTFTYQGGSNNVIDIQRPDGTHESKTYDAMHRVLSDTVPQTSSLNLTTWFIYNPSGTLWKVTDPRGSGPGDSNYTTTFAYDAWDFRTQMTYPNGSYRTWTYDGVRNLCARGAITANPTPSPPPGVQHFTYDYLNRKVTMTWTNNAEWAWFDYDAASRPQTSVNGGPGAWNQNPISTVFRQYDFAGRLTLDQQSVTGLGTKNVNYSYLPDGSVRWLTVSGVTPTYAYMFDYDAMARFQTITYGGSTAFQYHYDSASNERQRDSSVNGVSQFYTYDNLDRMTHVDVKKGNNILGSEDYGHDDMSRLISVTRNDNKQDWFSYYLDGELKTANYGASPTPTASPGNPGSPNGQCADPVFSQAGGCPYALLVSTSTATQGATIFYTSDPNGFVTPTHNGSTPTGGTLIYGGSILVPAGSAQFISAVAYNNGMDDSNVIQANMDNSCDLPPGADPNATPPPGDAAPTPDTSWTPEATPPPYQADPNDPPPDVTPPPAETPPPSPPPVSDDTPPALDPGKEVKTVDDYISLKMDPESMSFGVRDVTYYLDKMGNRVSVVDTGTTKTYTPNNLNEYSAVQGNTIVYNSQHQHELDTYGSVNYQYRNDEQLVNAARTDTGISYSLAYDALGRCVTRTTALPTATPVTKYYIYDGERPILEYDNTGALVARNVYGKGIDEILMRTDYTFNPVMTYYLQQDHEGSVIHVTDTSGTLMERYRYDVYGAPTIYPPSATATPIPASAVSNRFLFTGREYAGAFGFYEYRARAYHPGLGRFTSEDPKLFDAGDYNLYRYCHNDPEDMTDPMGLVPVEVDAETDALAHQADMKNLAAFQGSLRLGGYFGRYEYATSVFQNSAGVKSLSETRTDHLSSQVRPPRPPAGTRSLVENHNHTDNNNDATTHSRIGRDDANRGDTTGRTQEVISPDRTQQRYRPSDKASLEEKRAEGGIIEQKQNGAWKPLKGANTDLNNPYAGRNGSAPQPPPPKPPPVIPDPRR